MSERSAVHLKDLHADQLVEAVLLEGLWVTSLPSNSVCFPQSPKAASI
jgi:hypothetical protein